MLSKLLIISTATHHHLVRFQRAERQEPLAPHPAEGRQADDAEAADGERREGQRHAPGQALHVGNLGLVRGHQDGAGAEETA